MSTGIIFFVIGMMLATGVAIALPSVANRIRRH
jgi:hypothetical protein